MTTPAAEPQPELVPGMVRATVAEARVQAAAKGAATRARRLTEVEPADVDPVARVLVDIALVHLDRPFDYLVPATMAEDAVPGARVKVRFAGKETSGFVLARTAATEHVGALTPLRRVVSAEPVLGPAVAGLVGDVAARYAGSRSDVLRLAVPPRHAATEQRESAPAPAPSLWTAAAAREAWAPHPQAPAFLGHLADGGSPRAVWAAPPGADWPVLLAHAAGAVLASGRGSVLCVPDARDVTRLDVALTAVLGPGHHVALTADVGPARRYREFLAVSRGAVRIAVGTRSAAFAPVHDLGLVAVFDDGDDLFEEPRAPYPHVREVLLMRAEREGAAALVGGFARSAEAEYLVRSGWAHELDVPRSTLRERVRIAVAGATDVDRERDPTGAGQRMPTQVRDVVRAGLDAGPVLVQTPRAGYALALACARCRTPATCTVCAGPLALGSRTAPPTCRWCGTAHPGWACAVCGHHGLRAPVLGEARTAEELGRAFPGVPVLTSASGHVLDHAPDRPALVVATPGAEPPAPGGYAAVVLLDAWLLLARDDLRAGEEALRRWSNAVGLVRPGGRALLVAGPADPGEPAFQALVRWDHAGFLDREIEDRRSAHLPPTTRLATVTGPAGAVDDALSLFAPSTDVEVLGPVPVVDRDPRPGHPAGAKAEERLILRTPRARGAALSSALLELQRIRSARKLDPVRIRVDPPSL